MCFNTVIVNSGGIDLKTMFDAINIEMRGNPDGFSMFADGDVIRTLSRRKFLKFQKKHRKARLVHIHFRKASSGKIDLENVHMWKVGSYYVSHNGFASRVGEQATLSDTRQMVDSREFRDMVENERWGDVEDVLGKKDFFGVLMMTRADGKYAVFVMNKPLYVQAWNQGLLTFSNVAIRGLGIEYAGMLFEPPERTFDDSIVVFDTEKNKVVHEKKIVIRRSLSQYMYGVPVSFSRREDDDYVQVSPNVWVDRTYLERNGLAKEDWKPSSACHSCVFFVDGRCTDKEVLEKGECWFKKYEEGSGEIGFKDEVGGNEELPEMCKDCKFEDDVCDVRREIYYEDGECQRRLLMEDLEHEKEEMKNADYM